MLVRCALLLLAARALPPCGEDVALDPPCPERAPAPPATTLRLAINFDAPMVTEHDGAAFATFLHALASTNGRAPVVVYALAAGLARAERCLVRRALRARLAAPGSRAHVIGVDGALARFNATFAGLAHVSVATMARLHLPTLLPCVERVLYLDLDLLVLQSLGPLWALAPSAAPCGLSARPSINNPGGLGSAYVRDHARGPPAWVRDTRARFARARGFNAGVVLMRLARLRGGDGAFDRTVRRVAVEYGNDDQVTLNVFCAGNFTPLAKEWNMFHVAPWGGLAANQSQWRVLHFTGPMKPWLPDARFPNKRARALWFQYRRTFEEVLAPEVRNASEARSGAVATRLDDPG